MDLEIPFEFILIIQDKIFRVYTKEDCEKIAVQTFIELCTEYGNTTNEDSKDYWDNLMYETMNGNFSILNNFDFMGVRALEAI